MSIHLIVNANSHQNWNMNFPRNKLKILSSNNTNFQYNNDKYTSATISEQISRNKPPL